MEICADMAATTAKPSKLEKLLNGLSLRDLRELLTITEARIEAAPDDADEEEAKENPSEPQENEVTPGALLDLEKARAELDEAMKGETA